MVRMSLRLILGRPGGSSVPKLNPHPFALAQEKNKKFVYNMTGAIPINYQIYSYKMFKYNTLRLY